jgi:hypothetical protein
MSRRLGVGRCRDWKSSVNAGDSLGAELASVASACANAQPFQQSEVLDQARKAIVALPPELRQAILPGFVSAGRFSRLMAVGAHETAAIELLGSGLGYIASRSPDGYHIATVNGPGGQEFTEVAETLALGLIAGLVKLLQTLHKEQARGTYAHH